MRGESNAAEEKSRVGLCATCRFMRQITSERGSMFFLCRRWAEDSSFPKYPRLPVLQCRGFERLEVVKES